MTSLFCRHNRFTADCPICSKGTVLDSTKKAARPRPARTPSTGVKRSGRAVHQPAAAAREFKGPYVSAGPYERPDGGSYEVRLERVPGGIRLASWAGGAIERRAPVLGAADLATLVGGARERELLAERDRDLLERALATERRGEPAAYGASAGRSGDMREELRVEAGDDATIRIARWLYRPNSGWELQDAPVMLPAGRFAEAIREAVAGGALAPA